MSREDPSLQVKEDEETGQLLVSGLGELHLEVLRDRIEIEYGISARLGKMRAAFRESIAESQRQEITLEKTIGGAHMFAQLTISVESTIDEVDMTELQRKRFTESADEKSTSFELSNSDEVSQQISKHGANEVLFDFEQLEPVIERVKLEGDEYEKSRARRNKEELTAGASIEIYRSLDSLPLETKAAMKEAIEDALLCGTLLGYPMVNTRVRILDGRWSNLRSKNPLIFQQASVQLLRDLFQSSSPCLLEPFMNVELNVPERILGDLLGDITGKRGGRILGIKNIKARFADDSSTTEIDDSRKSIHALMPLSEMVGYNTFLRSISKGEALFTMTFSHYEQISGQKQAEIMDNPFYY